jgi:hypothetical protein
MLFRESTESLPDGIMTHRGNFDSIAKWNHQDISQPLMPYGPEIGPD